jgi:hypothetical protein
MSFSKGLLPLALAVFGLSASAHPKAPQKAGSIAREKLRTTMTSRIETYVTDPQAILVRAKILGSRFKQNGDSTESGAVTFKCMELYRGPAPEAGSIFEIEGTRSDDPVRRPLDRLNQWNALPLSMGDELLLALYPGRTPKIFAAVAAVGAKAQGGADLKEAVAIESTPIAERLERLRLAVGSESHLLQNYSYAALRVPGVATREQAALALGHAFDASHSENVRLALLAEMESLPYANMTLGPDAANCVILTSYLKAIRDERNSERATSLLNHFAALLGSKLSDDVTKDRDLRAKFVAAIHDPPKAQAAGILHSASAADPADQRLKRVAEAWAH